MPNKYRYQLFMNSKGEQVISVINGYERDKNIQKINLAYAYDAKIS